MMKLPRAIATFTLLAALAAACGQEARETEEAAPATRSEHDGLPPLSALAEGWNAIYPGGDTICVYGDRYGFFVRPGDAAKLLITFPGGGACWSGLTCSDEPPGRMDNNPRTVRAEDSPAGASGIFDAQNPENPFAGYSNIHVGYCTGDLHIGDAERANDGPVADGAMPASEVLHFNGFRNASAVLDWVFANFAAPDTVVVAGFTSGGYATPFYASLVADHYPEATVRHLGDGSGALFIGEKLRPLVEAWDTVAILRRQPGYENLAADNFTFEDVVVAAARRHPEIVFTQVITAHDHVFSELIAALGVAAPLLDVVEAGHAYVKSRVGNYRTFVAGGNRHVLSAGYFDALPRSGNRNRGWPDIYDRFYSYQVDGHRLRDWVADMAAGVAIQDVRCSPCDQVEYYGDPVPR